MEAMLKNVSELEEKSSKFDLLEENCSTTSMKILYEGAPKNTQHMFTWSESTQDNTASNAFLTNPQTVYSASKVVSQAQNGGTKSKKLIEEERFSKPNTKYYLMINKLLVFQDDKELLLKNLKKSLWSSLTLIPRFLKDLLVKEDTKKVNSDEREIDNFFNKINSAIKSQKYELIQHQNPELAINAIFEKLQSDLHALPFFHKSTLKEARAYILGLEAKENPSELEKKQIADYYVIVKERDERVACVEKAVCEGKNVTTLLSARKDHTEELTWQLGSSARAELQVEKFCEEYKKLRAEAFGPQFLRSNFITTLDKCSSIEEKLAAITRHIKENPNSRGAQAWNNCLSNNTEVKEKMKARYLASKPCKRFLIYH
jgi:hypothetical protein